MYYNYKKCVENWVKDIENCKAKEQYIRYRRIERVVDYLSRKVSKNYCRKNFILNAYYSYEYDNKTYKWNGYCMEMIKADGTTAHYKYRKQVGITNFKDFKLTRIKTGAF